MLPHSPPVFAAARLSTMQAFAPLPATKKLILVVIDGLTADVFEDTNRERGGPHADGTCRGGHLRARDLLLPLAHPRLPRFARHGRRARRPPHPAPRLVPPRRAAGRRVRLVVRRDARRRPRQAMKDAIVEMNADLASKAVTVYEALEDEGLVTAAVNVPCYRGRTRYLPSVPGLVRPVNGPKRFFYYNLFESDVTGAPLAVRGRAGGSVDAYAAAVGRWLVTRDGFDFLFFYLPDYDFLPRARPRRRARGLRAERQRRGRARRGRQGLDVPRPLRHRRLLRPRPDACRPGSPDPGRAARRPARPRHGFEPRGDGLPPARHCGRREVGGRAAESLRRDRRRPLPGRWRIARAPRGRGDSPGARRWRLARPRLAGTRQSERGRRDRLGRPGSRVRRPRRTSSRAGAHTARCSTGTPSSRCSSWAPRRRRPASWESHRSP